MIQRIQTIYLAVVLLISAVLFIPSIAPIVIVKSTSASSFSVVLSLIGISTDCTFIDQPASYISLLVLNCLIILFTLFAIFKFNNRPLQVKLCYFSIFLVFLLWGGMYTFTNMIETKTADPRSVFLLGFYLPPLQVILHFLAANAIKKDEKLVKSADRLR